MPIKLWRETEGDKEGIGGRREWRGKERSNERREEGKEIRRKGWRDRGRTEDKGFHLQKQTAISLSLRESKLWL